MRSPLELEVEELRRRLVQIEERVRIDAVAEMFLAGEHRVHEGDYFLLDSWHPTRLQNVSSDGKWTYVDTTGRTIEPYRVPSPDEYPRLYTTAEVAAIVSKTTRSRLESPAIDE